MSKVKKETNCKGCKYLDEYFGDCCHPKGQGVKNIQTSIDNCVKKNYAWKERVKK